jgi:hypothetical protein
MATRPRIELLDLRHANPLGLISTLTSPGETASEFAREVLERIAEQSRRARGVVILTKEESPPRRSKSHQTTRVRSESRRFCKPL